MLEKVLPILWEIIKVAVVPLGLYYIQRLITQRDEKREREDRERRRELDNQQKLQFLMMRKQDKTSEMTHLMAQKLHDKGIINGDLEAIDRNYRELDAEYEKEVKRLALHYSSMRNNG